MTETDALYAVSPLDGRYDGRTAPLSPYASEAALMRARVRVEVEYLIALADLEATSLELGLEAREHLRGLYSHFAEEDARLIKNSRRRATPTSRRRTTTSKPSNTSFGTDSPRAATPRPGSISG